MSEESQEFSIREKPAHKPPITGYTIGLTLVACIGGLLFGYDTGIMSGVQLFFGKSPAMRPMSTLWVELIVSITPGVAALFALVAGKASDKLGRRLIIILASGAFLVGSIICAIASSKLFILGGRAILGIAIGFASMIIPVYISEAAPLHLRGALVTCYQLMIATGFILANAVAAGFAYVDPVNVGWRLMFGFAAVPSILQLIGFMFLKDTPRYLYSKGRVEEAEAVLTKVYGGDDEWVQYDLSVIAEATREEEEIQKSIGSSWTIRRVMRTPHVRKALAIGCSLQMFQQFVGINSILYYTSEIIKGAGVKNDITNLWISCGIAAVQSVGTFIPMKLIEKWGRRPTLLTSMAAMVVALCAMGTAFCVISKDTAVINPARAYDGISMFDIGKPHHDFCGKMTSCDSCVTSPHCGYCHETKDESIGQCLPLDEHDETRSTIGFCAGPSIFTEYTMSAKSCTTKFTWMPIAFMVVYLFAFAFGVGALPWVLNAEMYPLWARSTCVALSTFTNWTFNLLVSMTFLSLGQLVTKAGSFFVYAFISFIGLIVFWFTVPETKGLGIEEIENLFKSRDALEASTSASASSEQSSEETQESPVKSSPKSARKSPGKGAKPNKAVPPQQQWFMVSKKALEDGSIDVEPATDKEEMRASLLGLFILVAFGSASHHKSKKSHLEKENDKPLPILIWHGMGDSCCNPLSMGAIQKHLEEKIPGVYVHSLRLGDNFVSDTKKSFFANMNELVALACIKIMRDPELQNGYNAIGFSQGALFLRALAQRCAKPQMHSLISIGGPQMGIFGLPYCVGDNFVCNSVRWLLEQGAYEGPIQRSVVQAQYWHDSNAEEEYRAKSIFLADINNENSVNQKYKENFSRLKNLVLVKFEGDHMVVPKDSEWFGYYSPDNVSTILAFNETRLYKEDRIGLKTLQDSGRLHFLSWPGEHLRMSLETLDQDIVEKFLA